MTLPRTLDTRDAVVVGLAAMLGTGVFVVPAAAAAEAGGLLLVALAVAALVALLNASSTASLAAVAPVAGGVYVYGRQHLGPSWGFLAGAAFLVGKTASCAAAALAVGTYATPGAPRAGAVLAVLVVTAATLQGLQRTARAGAVLVALVLLVRAADVVTAATSEGASVERVLGGPGRPAGVLPAAALLFFAFAGYARVTVLGGEVRDPARTIPRAVRLALLGTLVAYAAVCAALLAALGADGLAASDAPLAEVAGDGALGVLVRAGAVAAALGALLSLATGVGRTAYAMAGQRDAPALLARSPGGVPRPAQLLVGVVVLVAVLTGGLVEAVALSAGTVLLYYGVAHLAVLRSGVGDRRVAAAGLVGCLVLAVTLPGRPLLLGAALLAAACLLRAGLHRSGRIGA